MPTSEHPPNSDERTVLVDEGPGLEGVAEVESGGGSAKPLLVSFAATGATQVVQVGIAVLLARELGATGRGELAAIVLWPTLISTIGCLGAYQAATYFAARTDRLGTLVGSLFAFLAVDAVVLVGLGLLILPLVLGNHDPDVVADGQLFLAFFVPVNLVAVSMMSVLNGMHRFAWFQSVRVLIVAVTLVGLGAIVLLDELTISAASLCYLAGSAAAALFGSVVVLKAVWGSIRVEAAFVRELLSFGLKSQLSVGMWNLNERGDQLVISAFFSPANLGLYVVAVTTASVSTLVGFSAALVALPIIARYSEIEDRRRTARSLVGATLVAATVITVPIFILEPYLIEFFFGPEFAGAVDVGRVLLVGAVFFGLSRVLESIMQALGRPLESSIGEGIALGVTAIGLVVLLPTTGIIGAGITSLVAYLASAIFLTRRVCRALDVSTRELLVPDRQAFSRIVALIGR